MKILVRATNWVGDAIMSIAALEALRARWPQADISILACPSVAELYCGQPFVDRIIVLDASIRNPVSVEKFARQLRIEEFDCSVLFQNAFSAAWMAWRAGIRERIGYSRDARKALLTLAIPVPRKNEIPPHESYYYLELLRRIGWLQQLPQVESIRLQLKSSLVETAERNLQSAGTAAGRTRIALAPGAAFGSAKCWLPERFAALADSLIDEFRADVILFGAASEAGICRRIAARMRHQPINLAGKTSIGELPAMISRCQLFLGNDSGAMHIAGAVGLPVVAIFGPTDPNGTSPMALQRALVRRPVDCSPCFLRECPIDHRCMTRIEVADVRPAVVRCLENSTRG